MDRARKESLRQFLDSIEANDIVVKERKPETIDQPTVHDVPPINPQIVPELRERLVHTSKDLNEMVCWLEREISTITAHTISFVDVHSRAVDDIVGAADESVKSVYSLISRGNGLQKDLMKIEIMSSHLKSINKYLERLDNTIVKSNNTKK